MDTSPSILKFSFTLFFELVRTKWKSYLFFVLGKFVLLVLEWGGILGFFVLASLDPDFIILSWVLLFVFIIILYLFNTFFLLGLYRSLDGDETSSWSDFYRLGNKSLKKTFLYLILYSFLGYLLIMFVHYMWMQYLFLFEDVYLFIAAFSSIIMIWLSLPYFMTFFDVVLYVESPIKSFYKNTVNLFGSLWFRLFGSLLVWGLLFLLGFFLVFSFFNFPLFSLYSLFTYGGFSSVGPLFSLSILLRLLMVIVVVLMLLQIPTFSMYCVYIFTKKVIQFEQKKLKKK